LLDRIVATALQGRFVSFDRDREVAPTLGGQPVIAQRARIATCGWRRIDPVAAAELLQQTSLVLRDLGEQLPRPRRVVRAACGHVCEPDERELPGRAGNRLVELGEAVRVLAPVDKLGSPRA